MSLIDLFAWIVLVILLASVVAIFVALGMLPGHIARKRQHPWAEAVSVGGWDDAFCRAPAIRRQGYWPKSTGRQHGARGHLHGPRQGKPRHPQGCAEADRHPELRQSVLGR
jgi:uncharacterized protein DUF3302